MVPEVLEPGLEVEHITSLPIGQNSVLWLQLHGRGMQNGDWEQLSTKRTQTSAPAQCFSKQPRYHQWLVWEVISKNANSLAQEKI